MTRARAPAMCAATAAASWARRRRRWPRRRRRRRRRPVGVERDAGGAEVAGDPAPVRVASRTTSTSQLAARRPARAPRSASSSVAAPATVDAARPWWRPRRRRPSAAASDRHTSATPAARSSGVAGGPATPLARTITVSLVDVQPSTTSAVEASRATAAPQRRCSSAGSTAASVVSTASIVAMFGASIAAPLAMPPTVTPPPSTDDLLAIGVGGHDRLGRVGAAVGAAARRPARGCRRAIASIGSGMPMRPVEHTSTSSAAQPSSSATRRAHLLGVGRPAVAGGGVGVAAVEDDRARPGRRWRRGGRGRDAPARRVTCSAVNTRRRRPARRRRWRRATRSGSPLALMPQATPGGDEAPRPR